jgi:O-antigen/teichoic acid export membrane protein
MAATENLSYFEEYKGYARDIGLVIVAQVAVALLHFLKLPILTKWLGASLYGSWSLIWVTVVLVTPLAVLSLGMTLTRFLAAEKNKDKIREGFLSVVFTVFGAGVIISAILYLCSSPFASSLLGDSASASLVKLAAPMILTQALSQISIAFFRTFRQMKWYSALLALKAALQLGLMVGFLALGWELEGVIISVLASDVLCIIIALSAALKQTGFSFPRFTELKDYLKYGLPLVPNAAILWVIHSSDRYMVGYFMTAEDVGIYTAAYTLGSIFAFLISAMGMVLFPTISKSYDDGDTAKTRTYLKYSLKYLMMLAIPAAFGVSILAIPLLRLLTTSEFTSGNTVIPFVAAGLVVFSFYQVCLYIVHLVKKTYWTVRLLSIAAALNIGLNLLLIPHMGIVGAAVATLIAYGVLGILTVIVSFRYFSFDLGFSFLWKIVLASTVMAATLWLLNPSGLAGVVIAILLGIIIYSAIIFALKGFNRKELELFKQLVLWFRKKGRSGA